MPIVEVEAPSMSMYCPPKQSVAAGPKLKDFKDDTLLF
jgi:hypothetical protein